MWIETKFNINDFVSTPVYKRVDMGPFNQEENLYGRIESITININSGGGIYTLYKVGLIEGKYTFYMEDQLTLVEKGTS